MSKTLSNILTIFKVAKIVAKVAFILCIVGVVGCLIGIAALPLAAVVLALVKEGLDLPSSLLGCIIGLIACAGGAVFLFLAERYCKNVLDAGTPFTLEGAKECFRLGIASIIVAVATAVLAGIAAFIIQLIVYPAILEPDVSGTISISTGLFFLFLSLIFKHGAELEAAAAEKAQQEAEKTGAEAQ